MSSSAHIRQDTLPNCNGAAGHRGDIVPIWSRVLSRRNSDLHCRIHFAFAIMFHYIFPAHDGAGISHVIMTAIAVTKNHKGYHQSTQFWARILAINFVMGVVTGIPMEFQFGTNWATFSQLTGGILGRP